jgi:prolipoprotein diacylglyceryltransferase
MHPRLLTTPLFTVHTFGLLLASAYVAAFWWLIREGRREGLRDFPQYAAAPSEMFSLSVFTSAGDFYGGFIGALVASAIFFQKASPTAVLAHSRSVRRGHRTRPGDRSHWLLHGG